MPFYKRTTTPTLQEVEARLVRANANFVKNQRRFIRNTANRFQTQVNRETPVDTGEFKGKHQIKTRVRSVNDAGFTFSAVHPLSTWIRQGTEAHTITGNPFLVFNKGGRKWVVRQVQHPGTRANNYVERAKNQWLPGTKSGLRKIASDWIKDFVG